MLQYFLFAHIYTHARERWGRWRKRSTFQILFNSPNCPQTARLNAAKARSSGLARRLPHGNQTLPLQPPAAASQEAHGQEVGRSRDSSPCLPTRTAGTPCSTLPLCQRHIPRSVCPCLQPNSDFCPILPAHTSAWLPHVSCINSTYLFGPATVSPGKLSPPLTALQPTDPSQKPEFFHTTFAPAACKLPPDLSCCRPASEVGLLSLHPQSCLF